MQENDLKQTSLFNNISKNKVSWFSNAIDTLNVSELPGWPDTFGDSLINWNSCRSRNPIRVLSLFSGAGGLDIGFHDVGFHIVECNELEEAFAATLEANSQPGSRLHGSNIVCSDIRNYHPELKDIDFIIGGPPCQTFSAAGARAAGVNGTDDERGNLFWEYVRILNKLRPKGFLFENVYRIVGAQGGKPWKQIQKAFQDVGYKLHWRILDAADYGVPQFRERLIIVGLREGTFAFPLPSHGPDSSDNRDYYSAGKAIASLNIKKQFSGLSGRHGHLLNDIPPGLNYSFYTEKLGHPKPIFAWRSKFSDYLYKADSDTPVRTIKAQGGQYTGPFHWENRPFTVEEYKRLQTFPDDYQIVGNRQRIIHQIGNSVPPQFARVLALSIMQEVFGEDLPFEIEFMPDSFKLGFRKRKNALTKVYAKKAADAISKMPEISPNTIAKSSGKAHIKLLNDFQLHFLSNPKVSDFTVEYSIHEGDWIVNIFEENENKDATFELTISPKKPTTKQTEIRTILLRSYSVKSQSFLGLWKYIEMLIKKHFYKDDLVQLFGYYQNKQNYSINMNVLDSNMLNDPFWKVLSQISNGVCVGKIISIGRLSQEYNLPEDILISELKALKRLGFEIRNHNTNIQIGEGKTLIPYAFPSLNERSLQRLTEL